MAGRRRPAAEKPSIENEIAVLLDGAPPVIRALTTALVDLLRHEHPELDATVRFGWRSVNFRHPQAGHLCAVFPYSNEVKLYFEQGSLLSDPGGLLDAGGKQVRALRLRPGEAIPAEAIGLFLAEAIALKA